MDRNSTAHSGCDILSIVALRKESVDRNQGVHYDNYNLHWSLSARRAWIEICGGACGRLLVLSSLSARRAWIEIIHPLRGTGPAIVALRKESVDRNYYANKDCDWVRGRSPQGERG